MAKKRFKLSPETKSSTYVQDGVFKFRTSYEKLESGRKTIFAQKKCPVIIMNPEDVLSTENETAQDRMGKSPLPNRSFRQGSNNNPDGIHLLFEDVTDTTTDQDVDIDLDARYFS